jgi:hypothetical protein
LGRAWVLSFVSIFFGACVKDPVVLTPTMKGLPAEPGLEIAPAGAMSCARVFTTPSIGKTPNALSVDERSTVVKPVDLVIQVGGSGRSAACEDWLQSQQAQSLPTSEPSSQPSSSLANSQALWFGAMLGYGRDRKSLREDFDTIELQEAATLTQMMRDEGAQFRIYNLELRGESRALLTVQSERSTFTPKLNVLDRNDQEAYELRLHVIDTRWRKAFAWRLAVPFLIEPQGKGLVFTPGMSLEGLFYPFRHSAQIDSFFLRALSIDAGVGSTSDQENLDAKVILATLGVTWREFVSVGYAFDISVGAPRAPYVSFTLFSSAGVFGLIPYEEIRKAIQQIRFSNQRQE